jgi:hypothetical protein
MDGGGLTAMGSIQVSQLLGGELTRRSQAGDSEAFGELVAKYRTKILTTVCHIVGNESEAWDLAQEGFVKAWRLIHRFQGRSPLALHGTVGLTDYRVGTLLERQRFARQTVHLASFQKHQDTGDNRLSRTWVSLLTHPARSLEQLVNRRRGHKSELPSSHDSILSSSEKFLPQQMRARAEFSLQVRWGNQDRKGFRPSFYTALFFQELQYRTVGERSAHLTRREQFAERLLHFREHGNFSLNARDLRLSFFANILAGCRRVSPEFQELLDFL